ncbi:FtsK/SpoIIIE domain-containing protein [Dactylosporangium sp. CS-033363]|uniref:FtsK/SpoIIIE domain-containing protein n=1 Tax=Dactylosporangium sp. CS-033363 TaxID=3239935 RepID=UPI003D8F894C
MLEQVWGIEDLAAFDPAARWAQGSPGPVVPIGLAEDGRPVTLDLRAEAEGGAGPHALVVGATGTGKSELLRTVVLGLAVHNSPDEVAVLLVDHLAMAAFPGFERLPHSAGVAGNLLGRDALGRLDAAVQDELLRRNELLRAAGVAGIGEYRAAGHVLPRLVAVVEDVVALLAARPDFAETFTTVARIGRSLGVHLVLATPRLHPGLMRGLDARIGCRVELPGKPGLGLLREGAAAPVRFRVGRADHGALLGRLADDHLLPPRAGRVTVFSGSSC